MDRSRTTEYKGKGGEVCGNCGIEAQYERAEGDEKHSSDDEEEVDEGDRIGNQEGEEGGECDGNGSETEEEVETILGIVNMTEEISKLRGSRGRVAYYNMTPVHIGRMKGVQIKFMSDMKPRKREALISSTSALNDAATEIRRDEEESDERSGDGSVDSSAGYGRNAEA